MAFASEADSLCCKSVMVFHYTGIIFSVLYVDLSTWEKVYIFYKYMVTFAYPYTQTRAMYDYIDLTLLQSLQPVAVQLSMKAALPLTKYITATSYRNSGKGFCATIRFPGHG